jgi:amidase
MWERAYTSQVTSWWNNFDLLLTPAVGEPAPVLGELVPPAGDPLSLLGRYREIWSFAAPFSVTGQPAISLPIGRSGAGLPVGIQLVASLGREDLLIQVAAQLERTSPFGQLGGHAVVGGGS